MEWSVRPIVQPLFLLFSKVSILGLMEWSVRPKSKGTGIFSWSVSILDLVEWSVRLGNMIV